MFGLLAEIAGDIILKTDRDGFIDQATPHLDALGVDLTGQLIAPHISDLADHTYATQLRGFFMDTMRGASGREHFEFPLPRKVVQKLAHAAGDERRPPLQRRWFALRLRPLPPVQDGTIDGVLGVLRAIPPDRAVEAYWNCAGGDDPLDGIANGQAFAAAIARHHRAEQAGAVALFEIDSFRAQCLRMGAGAGDAMIRAFAEFLSAIVGSGDMVARLQGHRFAVLMHESEPAAALARARDIITTFAQLSHNADHKGHAITASAGLAMVEGSFIEICRRAERALILAGAAGGGRADLFELFPAYLAKGHAFTNNGDDRLV